SAPSEDAFANWARGKFSPKTAYALARWKNVLLVTAMFKFCRRWPEAAKRLLRRGLERELRSDFDIDRHFTPFYNPWEQRMCLVPDADLFKAIKDNSASVVTAEIDCFTEGGIKLRSGEELPADLIVTATGLDLQFLANLVFFVDGKQIDPSQSMTYKSMMFSDIPNLASCFGYTNASWTLKCDLTCEYVTRLLNYMKKKGHTRCIPRLTDPEMGAESMLNLTSGYIQRTAHRFAKQGTKAPWRLYQNYILDSLSIGLSGIADPALEFSGTRFQPEPGFEMAPSSGQVGASRETDAVH
ncbi:MAG: NAD(P)/FAD-dependent oxidoreductase, partial [Myxococcota bacterium]